MVASMGLSAQHLTGSVDAYGAWNFGKGHKENAALKLNYDSTLYYVHIGISGQHNYTPTTEYTSIMNDNVAKDNMSIKIDTNQVQNRRWNMGIDLDFGYYLTSNDLLTLKAHYAFDDTHKTEKISSSRYQAHNKADYSLDMDTLFGKQNDWTLDQRHTLDVTLGYLHRLSKTNSISLSLNTLQALGGEDRTREVRGKMFDHNRNYNEDNTLNEGRYSMSLHYDDQQLAGIENLKLKTGVDLIFDIDVDRYRADYNEQTQTDTTFLSNHRDYLTQYTEAFANLQYQIGGWIFGVKERPQVYSNLQWELQGQPSPKQISRHTSFANIAEANIGYQLNTHHRFDLIYNYDVTRPNYKEFSSIIRFTNNEGEYLRGNEKLRPEKRHKLNFRYSYQKDEHLLTLLDVFYANKKDKIEKLIVVSDIQTKEIETLKTYTNSNTQQSIGGSLQLKLNYEFLESKLWSSIVWERFTYYSGKRPKNECSYQIGLWLNAHLSKAVDLTSSLTYVSPTYSAFTEKNEYIGANLRLTYKSPVGLNLIIEANDIINRPRTEINWNEDMTYMKIKEVIENRNCLGVGISYTF